MADFSTAVLTYHARGDDEAARACLEYAYQMNPDLPGAVRITRALGLPAKKRNRVEETASHKAPRWTRPTQIAAPWQIRLWAECGMWERILDLSNPGDYLQRVLPAARATLRTVAWSLGGCDSSAAEPALIGLLHFSYYWDVSRAAATALSKIGGSNALATLEEHRSKKGGREEPYLNNCISYLRARLQSGNALVDGDETASLAHAIQEASRQDYGLARFLLERLIKRLKPEHPDFIEASILWARSCAAMNHCERAVEIARPIYTELRDGGHRRTLGEIESWLWDSASFEEYHEQRDEFYQWALDLNLSLISMAATPDDVLGPLRRLTRWLESLGQITSAQIIRQLIRNEAPGTYFVDTHDRENYFRKVVLTNKMGDFLKVFDSRIQLEAVPKLNEVMNSEPWIGAGP